MNRLPALVLASLVALLVSFPAMAEDCTGAECDAPEAFFPFYCRGERNGTLRLGLDSEFNIEFRANFEGESEFNQYALYLTNGPTPQSGKQKEIFVKSMKCTVESGLSVCRAAITAAKATKISTKFDTDQAIINVSLRRGEKDVCFGKFTNNADKITENGFLARSYCRFVPREDATLSGDGYFEPEGYGATGSAHFQLWLEGFPTGETLRGCIPGAKGYEEIFRFTAYEEGTTDSEIYGTLNDVENALYSEDLLSYSYDLLAALRALKEGSGGGASALFGSGRSLSGINHQVSAPAASSGRSSSNTVRKKSNQNAKKKKRKRSKRKSRGAFLAAKKVKKSTLVNWLNFDPLSGQEVTLTRKCNEKGISNSFGVLQCGSDETVGDSTNRCVWLRNTEQPSYLGRACLDARSYVSMLTVKTEGLPAGEYSLCLLGQSKNFSFTVAADNDAFRGKQTLTDSSYLSEQVPNVSLASNGFEALSNVKIGKSADCSDALLSGDF